MALVNCPECHKSVSDQAFGCPQCGRPLRAMASMGYEYRSKATIAGLPLLHIAVGVDPTTGKKRIAKGIVAIGDIAVGVLALGGVALGGIAIGGCSFGLAVLGGLAIGVLFALGGAAVGIVAIGGFAVGYYALGGAALGPYTISGMGANPEAVEFFKRSFGVEFPPGRWMH